MSLSETLLPEFDQEMATTRRMLERVPAEKLDWLPHPKSMPLGRLATHLAEIPGWGQNALKEDSIDLEPVGGPAYEPRILDSKEEILELFDKNVADTRAALATTSDEAFGELWSLKKAGETLFSMPRTVVLRSFFLNHNVHHRAQLSVYLRLNEVPVPQVYGPTADETGM